MDSDVCRVNSEYVLGYTRWVEERLIPSFGNWDEEVEKEGNRVWESLGRYFNPENDDPADYAERAYEDAISFGMQLAEINAYMLSMSISGLYHIWEKQIIKHLKREFGHYKFNKEIKIRNWEGVVNCFYLFSTNFKKLPFYNELNELRLVANVTKHGQGVSYEQLITNKSDVLKRDNYGQYFLESGDFSLLMSEVYPTIMHFNKYKKAVLAFWDYKFWSAHGERLFLRVE